MIGIRHLIQCHCVLPQYRKSENPIFHKFIVFSTIDENEDVLSKFVECNNCGVIHNITDICKSEIVHKVEDVRSIITIDDIIPTLPPNIVSILSSHKSDISIWEHVKFIYDNDRWGDSVTIARDQVGDTSQIKVLTIKSENRVKIDSHARKDEILGEYELK